MIWSAFCPRKRVKTKTETPELPKADQKSNGMVNSTRAVTAAKLSLTMSVDDAIGQANVTVGSQKFASRKLDPNTVIVPMPLTPQFSL